MMLKMCEFVLLFVVRIRCCCWSWLKGWLGVCCSRLRLWCGFLVFIFRWLILLSVCIVFVVVVIISVLVL